MPKSLSCIELSGENLVHNIRELRKILMDNKKIVAVLKANAYGHGQNEVASLLEPYADYFQVDDIEELRLLRKVSKKPTLVLGYIMHDDLEEAVMNLDGTLVMYDIERLMLLDAIGAKHGIRPKVHIKIDAHLGRQGVMEDELDALFAKAKELKHIEIEGIYSHFANIEDTLDSSHAELQTRSFNKARAAARRHGFTQLITHQSATSGLLAHEHRTENSLVRLGIGLYGMWPSVGLQLQHEGTITLKPVMRWTSRIAQVKRVPAGYTIGYGLTYTTTEPTTIAIVPQGYSDGYDRGFSNNSSVLIQGKRCPIRGRISMNMLVVDISQLDDLESVKQEEEVVLLGRQGAEVITAEELAARIGTINYELTTRISPLLPRIVI